MSADLPMEIHPMRFPLAILTGLSIWLSTAALAPAMDPLELVRSGQSLCTIVRGADDDFAAERLKRWFADNTQAQVEVVMAGTQPLPSQGCLLLVGSAASNSEVGKLASELSLDLDPTSLTAQGYLARRVRHADRDYVLLAGGGRDGTIYAVVDLINGTLKCHGQDASLDALDAREIPRFQYRWFWNWDNRMDWGGAGQGSTVMAAGAKAYAYTKNPDAFLIDGKRCVDFMADHKFNGMILWGFLRDDHGGVEAGQELCRYAARRGVRILPGVGTSGYGGYYYSGQNEFNSTTWLAVHPELRAVGKDGQPYGVPCPSKQANQDWLDRGAEWLLGNFEIGGVNLEMGDFFVCYCDDCKRARAAIHSREPDHYKDMAISHRTTLQTMRRLAPKAWLSYATYTGYDAAMMATPPKFLEMIPEDAVCQWTLTSMARKWPSDVRPMAKHNLGYLHWCNRSTHTEDDFYLPSVREICRNAASAGFEGLDTYGELAAERPNVELCYLAWEAFLWNPDLSIDEFVDRRLAPLYGGVDPARTLLKIIPFVQTKKQRDDPQRLAEARRLAVAARETSSPEGRSRWDRLIAYLDRQQPAK
jgi:hypothetical protein